MMTSMRALLPLALLLSACASRSVIDQSLRCTRLGLHDRAFQLLDQERVRRMDAGEAPDAEFEGLHRTARVRYLLETGRDLVFAEQEEKAVVAFAGVLALEPGHEEAIVLRDRARVKQAMRATALGDDALFQNDLELALRHYLDATRFVAEFPPALAGADKVHQAVARMETRAQQQFLEAVRKLPEFRYMEVRWHAANVMSNDPKRAEAQDLQVKANRELALKAMARGRECQAKDQFGAALMEFRAAKALDPAVPEVDVAIEAMKREVEASAQLEKATMQMRNGAFAEARASLAKAGELTVMLKAAISELTIETRRREGMRDFERARDLEILGQKREALVAFEALAAAWPDGLRDEKARVDGLRADIESAEKEWAAAEAAEAAGDQAGALEHYEASERFYALYRDAKVRIQRVKARLAANASGGS